MPGRPKRKQDLILLEKIGEEPVAELLESAMPIAEVCRQLKVGKRALMEWLESEPERAGLLSRARARAAHHLAEQALDIADDVDGETQRDRLRVDTRKWLAAKWNPKEYSEQKQGVAVQVNIGDMHLDALRHSAVTVQPIKQPDGDDDDTLPPAA